MRTLFTEILYRPLFNALAWLYQNIAFQDLGVAIILLTIVVRIVLFPLFHKTAKHQHITQDLQPQIKAIQKKHKEDKETQAKEIMELYGKHKINPLTPILVMLIQLPIIYAVYRIFINGFSNGALDLLYPSIHLPETPNHDFLGLINDLTVPSMAVAIFAAITQYFQGKLAFAKRKKSGQEKKTPEFSAEAISRRMVLFMPVFTLILLSTLPAAIGLYWSTTTVFSIFQQAIVNRALNKERANNISLGSHGRDERQNSKDI
ncbi:MAG: YidC/Oxa1 family membrane protein insertase [Candidatus Colwellbacteria bacterium]|nr:YidC/Oxa1 family membrane protein insertase [Candidatus Colwellbacteria bacterium]